MTYVEEYLASLPDVATRETLEHIRSIIHATVADVEECKSYGMPGFKYDGKYLVGFSVFKDHIGLFPTSEPIEKLAAKLTDFKTSKGGIQFTPEHPIPDKLIEELLRIRVTDISKQ